jgi:hypothetical protein
MLARRLRRRAEREIFLEVIVASRKGTGVEVQGTFRAYGCI